MRYKAVFFDLDKTLWTFKDADGRRQIYRKQGQKLIEILIGHGVEVKWDANFMGSVVGNGIWAAERAEYYSTAIPPDYGAILRRIVEFWVGEMPTDLDWDKIYASLYVDEAPMKSIYPDVLPSLQKLKDADVKLAIVSNRTMGGEAFTRDFGSTPLAPFFDEIVVSCDVGFMKPHTEIFRIAMRRLGVAADEAAMVGDLLRADVIGAQNAGITGIWINRDRQPNEYPSVKPDFEITDFHELTEIVLGDEGL